MREGEKQGEEVRRWRGGGVGVDYIPIAALSPLE